MHFESIQSNPPCSFNIPVISEFVRLTVWNINGMNISGKKILLFGEISYFGNHNKNVGKKKESTLFKVHSDRGTHLHWLSSMDTRCVCSDRRVLPCRYVDRKNTRQSTPRINIIYELGSCGPGKNEWKDGDTENREVGGYPLLWCWAKDAFSFENRRKKPKTWIFMQLNYLK